MRRLPEPVSEELRRRGQADEHGYRARWTFGVYAKPAPIVLGEAPVDVDTFRSLLELPRPITLRDRHGAVFEAEAMPFADAAGVHAATEETWKRHYQQQRCLQRRYILMDMPC